MQLSLETALLRAIEKGQAKTLLFILSKFYQFAVFLRNLAYDKGFFSITKGKMPVISVGNIKAGGTGKTPFSIKLATDLSKRADCLVLYRGYRKSKNCQMGDEAMLLQQRVPWARVASTKNRADFVANNCADVVILDDGMQHRKLFRDIEIICMQGDDLFCGGHFLPRGLLRDSPKRLSKADLIVLSGSSFKGALQEVAKYTSAPVICVEKEITGFVDLSGRLHTHLPFKEIAYFCAIANPKAFEKTLVDAGFIIKASSILPDHATFKEKNLKRLLKKAPFLVCTEKDIVKLKHLKLPIFALRVDLKIVERQEIYDALLDKIASMLH